MYCERYLNYVTPKTKSLCGGKPQTLALTLRVVCRGHFPTKIKSFLKKIDSFEILLWNVFFQLKHIFNKVRAENIPAVAGVLLLSVEKNFRKQKIQFSNRSFFPDFARRVESSAESLVSCIFPVSGVTAVGNTKVSGSNPAVDHNFLHILDDR